MPPDKYREVGVSCRGADYALRFAGFVAGVLADFFAAGVFFAAGFAGTGFFLAAGFVGTDFFSAAFFVGWGVIFFAGCG